MREFAVAVYQLTGEPILITPEANNGKREILPTSNIGDSGGFQCLGGSNWTICSPLSQINSEHFETFSLSYWGPILITPEGQLWEKGNSSNFQYG